MKRIKILFIDSEGGHGGSSISLFSIVKNLDKRKFESAVVSRKYSNLYGEYNKNKITCYIYKNLPKLTAVKKETINIYSILKFFFYDWLKSYSCRKKLVSISQKYDYIHFNHINLFLLAKWLRKKNKKSIFTMHIRTNPHFNTTSQIQAKIANKFIDRFIFITRNELATFKKLVDKNNVRGSIIHNIVERKKSALNTFSYLKKKNFYNIGLISNYSYVRGTDRFVDIIKELNKITQHKFLFIIAGDNTLSNDDRKRLKIKNFSPKTLAAIAKKENVNKFCTFLGHIKNPNDFYPIIDILIKPTRESNPWGRDILEAMMYGIPVISVGTYSKFVNNKTGLLMNVFDAKQCAIYINRIMKNKSKYRELGRNAKKTVESLCSSKVCKKQFEKFWL